MILQGNLALEFGTITKCLVYNYTRVHGQIFKCSEYSKFTAYQVLNIYWLSQYL